MCYGETKDVLCEEYCRDDSDGDAEVGEGYFPGQVERSYARVSLRADTRLVRGSCSSGDRSVCNGLLLHCNILLLSARQRCPALDEDPCSREYRIQPVMRIIMSHKAESAYQNMIVAMTGRIRPLGTLKNGDAILSWRSQKNN